MHGANPIITFQDRISNHDRGLAKRRGFIISVQLSLISIKDAGLAQATDGQASLENRPQEKLEWVMAPRSIRR
jgi:hypothetical protein